MSSQSEGKSCVFCKAYLFEEDDVVVCPVCGAPHHRECYERLGHCAEQERHGTENEYCRIKERVEKQKEKEANKFSKEDDNTQGFNEIICPACHSSYDKNLTSCPNCSAPNAMQFGGFTGGFVNFNPLGNVPPDYKIDEDVTAKEAMRFVVSNTHRYIPKFATLNKKKKVSWNWLAFLFPTGWFFSRKMFKNGFVAGAFSIISSLCSIPLANSLYNLGITPAKDTTELYKNLIDVMPQISKSVIILAIIGIIINLLVNFISAMFGDYLYKKYTVKSIKIIKKSEDQTQGYRKLGGVNIFLFIVGYMAVQYIPQFLSIFI